MAPPHTVQPRIALLESRMSRELSRLVEKHGGNPLCVPALREVPATSERATAQLLEDLVQARHEIVIFMTGVAASLLFEAAERAGRRQELVQGLRRALVVARGPKPTAALRGFGVPPSLTAREPYTSAELIDALSGMSIEGRRVLLFHYGERGATLAETLRARRALLEERWLYRWVMPDDTRALEQLVASLLAGEVDALVITCQVQFRHLLEVARQRSLVIPLLKALREEVVVAAMGPTCHAILQLHGVPVDVMPDLPKMGPLVRSLMLHLEHTHLPAAAAAVQPVVH
ncbi:MAG TPA: uroporphyrinogen-III synthase [Polyangiaceae bacterium]|jgi:uroporphyrinogen-III synthase|nr:uroporphyrinogen-III synthase [Polyangiaceae bacterium]